MTSEAIREKLGKARGDHATCWSRGVDVWFAAAEAGIKLGVSSRTAVEQANAVELVFWLLVDVLAKRGAPCAS